jgi:hypothetical protein
VAEAADALGITVDAVRSRIKRGTIDHERKGGRVYVLLGADEPRPGHDQDTDQGGDQGTTAPEDRTAELIATLQEQLQAERLAHAEARRLLMAALERIPPQLEAPPEARESPEAATDRQSDAQVPPRRHRKAHRGPGGVASGVASRRRCSDSPAVPAPHPGT